jgi:serine/threonine protein kinase
MLEPGTELDRYRVEHRLGEGGMATVYKVRHLILDTFHALKVLKPELMGEAELRGRFLAEGKIQARLRHPYIVPVTDVVVVPGVAGLVMDFIPGDTLEGFLRSHPGPPPAELVAAIFPKVLRAVGYAHRNGVIHRDLKPSNVLLEEWDGERVPRVLDFGIAAAHHESAERQTRTGARLGTPHYMSPEQIRDPRGVTPRSDIFSLGVTLYELATGKACFDDESDFNIQLRIVQGAFDPPERVNPALSPVVVGAINRALRTDPMERFATCEEFAAALGAGPLASSAAASHAVGKPQAVAAGGRYLVDPRGLTVLDTHTKLLWQRTVAGKRLSWAEAHFHAKALSLEGGGWRMPTREELLTLVTHVRSLREAIGGRGEAVIDAQAFPDTPAEPFWTSSIVPRKREWAFEVDFGSGGYHEQRMSVDRPVRCVRGP